MGRIVKNNIDYGGCSVDQTYDPSSAKAQSGIAVAEAIAQVGDHPVVQTKQELYTLQNTYRGMVVYVIDEDNYYKLVNDLPSFDASWTLYSIEMEEVTEAEIDAMFT